MLTEGGKVPDEASGLGPVHSGFVPYDEKRGATHSFYKFDFQSSRQPSVGKRAADLSMSIIALVVFGPVMLCIALLIRIFDHGPVLFRHRRIGLNGESFDCLKFRTMAQDAEERLASLLEKDENARREWHELQKITNDPRVTAFGRFLRVSSLDELPQFINVLRGEMSMVGPRPIIESERARYGRYFKDYCSVRPGLTGVWQVSGRNCTSYRRRVAMDVFYARNCSLGLDLRVILKTPAAILGQEGVY